MFEFSDAEREYLKEMHALSVDFDGREVLAGLTFEETVLYMAHTRKFAAGIRDREYREAYLRLREKHERARLQLLHMDNYLRNQDSPVN